MDQESEEIPLDLESRLSPDSLQEICLDYVCDNLTALCTFNDNAIPAGLQFRDPDTILNIELSENLLKKLCEKKQISDEVLSIFSNPCTTMLKRAWLTGSSITRQGLYALARHKMTELDAARMKNLTIDELVEVFGETGLCNLRHLNIGWMEVSRTGKKVTRSNDHVVAELSSRVRLLENLDISMLGVETLIFLRAFKTVPLKSLTAFHTHVDFSDSLLVKEVVKFDNLQHLDIATDCKPHMYPATVQYTAKAIDKLLQDSTCLPQLTSIDISGNRHVAESSLKMFFDHRPGIRFLGLTITSLCEAEFLNDDEHISFRPGVKITGHHNETQVMEGLRRYTNRPNYLHELMCSLFDKTNYLNNTRVDIIELVLVAMRNYPRSLGIQMAGSWCLLPCVTTHNPLVFKWLAGLYNCESSAHMFLYLTKNPSLPWKFDYLRAAQLIMECIIGYSNDHSMCRTASVIGSILVHKLSTEQKAILGTQPVIQYGKVLEWGEYAGRLVAYRSFTPILCLLKCHDNAAAQLWAVWTLWHTCTKKPDRYCSMVSKEGGMEILRSLLQTPHVDDAVIALVKKTIKIIDENKHLCLRMN
uniref:Protein zyg-11 homolog B-like n=1 Tax=Saccoglossus kowalevskii TaxID=10224 RepID=A0ABM0MRP4_SACKO|nr:PREDICTED: protein zyg-11 homolog B-like [Saccoglossus kowalevskii]